jgi:hypothetical protein
MSQIQGSFSWKNEALVPTGTSFVVTNCICAPAPAKGVVSVSVVHDPSKSVALCKL